MSSPDDRRLPFAPPSAPGSPSAPDPPADPSLPPPAAEASGSDPIPPTAPGEPMDETERRILEAQVVGMLQSVYDPEIPVNIYEMGMIYDIALTKPSSVRIKMTLTSPMCPVAGTLPGEVQKKIEDIPGVTSALIDLVWDPPWTPDKMSEAAKLQLGML